MNVIPISEKEGLAPTKESAATTLLDAARNIAMERLHQALATMLNKVDDALFEMAEKSENNSLQTIYFDSMREVRLKRSRIEGAFKGCFLAAFRRRRDDHGVTPLNPAGGDAASIRLTLVDEEQVEEDIAVAGMIDKITQGCREELYGLNKRVGLLLGVPDLDTGANPLGPDTICNAIKEAVAGVEAGVQIRLIILKLFDRYVASEVEAIYQTVNAFFIDKQVLPEVRTSIRRTSGGTRGAAPASGQPGNALEAPAPASENLLGMLQQLLGPGGGNGAAAGGMVPSSGWAAVAPVVMGSLTQLQQSGMEPGGGNAVAATGSAMPSNMLREIRARGLLPTLDHAGDMTLDIVAMLFDYILDDRNLPDPVRALIGRLQIPILKVALLDKEFFSRKSHPARRLLNSMAEQAVEWAADEATQREFHRIAERIVQRILDEFEDDPKIFAKLVEDFEKALDDGKRDAQIRAERTARVVQGQSKLEQAKLHVREIMASRLRQLDDYEVVRNFLLTHWKRLLITDCVQEGENGESFLGNVATMDDLVWSVAPKHDSENRRKLTALLPGLLNRLKNGMEAAAMPPIARSGFLGKLAKCHTDAVRGEVTQAAGDMSAPDASAVTTATAAMAPVPLDEDVHETTFSADVSLSVDTGQESATPGTLAHESPSGDAPAPVSGGNIQPTVTDEIQPAPAPLEFTLPPESVQPAAPTERTIPDAAMWTETTADTGGDIESEDLPPLDLELEIAEAPAEFNPDARNCFDAETLEPVSETRPPPQATTSSLAEALRERLLYDTEVKLADVLPQSEDNVGPAATDGGRTVTMNTDSLFELFVSGDKSADELAQLAELGDIEIEELTLEEASPEIHDEIDDKYLEIVKELQPGTWLEFRGIDETVTRAKLAWVNSTTDTFLFTDRSGHKLPDRTRNGLVAEFRRGSARIAGDVPLLDRAFTRLLDGLGGQQREPG